MGESASRQTELLPGTVRELWGQVTTAAHITPLLRSSCGPKTTAVQNGVGQNPFQWHPRKAGGIISGMHKQAGDKLTEVMESRKLNKH